MLPEVEVYCETMLGPELTQVVRDAFRAMYQFNSTGDDAGYLNIIFSYGNVNVVDIQDMFFDKLNSDLDILLNEHLVFLKPSTSISCKTEMLNALYIVSQMSYDSLQIFLPMLESEISSEDKWFELVQNLSFEHPVEVLEAIERVDTLLITTILQRARRMEDNQPISENDHASKALAEIKVFSHYLSKSYSQEKTALGLRMASAGFDLGHEIELYFSYARESIERSDPKDIDQLVLNALSLAIISDRGANDLPMVLSRYLDIMGAEQSVKTKALMRSTLIFSAFVAYKSKEIEGVKT